MVYPVDCHRNAFTPKAAILEMDLSDEMDVRLAVELLQQERPVVVHFGLPCGTCLRARDKAVPLALRKQGAPSPPPLRDHDHLLGLPHLSPQMRVDSANKLYNQAVELLFVCYSLGLRTHTEAGCGKCWQYW